MEQQFRDYASFNLWAHQTICNTILEMDPQLCQQIVKSSFPNLYATVLHLWDAESIWWQRLKGHQQLLIPSQQFNPDMKEVINGLLDQAAEWKAWVDGATAADLSATCSYTNLRGHTFHSTVWEIILHLFNHGTYHRGQLVTMMRTLGLTDLPATDFIHWCRSHR